MIKIFLQNKRKLGYIYLSFTDSTEIKFLSQIVVFEDEYKMKSFIVELKIQSIKFMLDAFISTYKQNNKVVDDLDSKCIDTLQKYNMWLNHKDFSYERTIESLSKRKEEFVTLCKYAKKESDKLIMIYKLLFEYVEENQS